MSHPYQFTQNDYSISRTLDVSNKFVGPLTVRDIELTVYLFYRTSLTSVHLLIYSPNLLMFGMVASIGLVIALGIKRKETPTNMYLLAAFVSAAVTSRMLKQVAIPFG